MPQQWKIWIINFHSHLPPNHTFVWNKTLPLQLPEFNNRELPQPTDQHIQLCCTALPMGTALNNLIVDHTQFAIPELAICGNNRLFSTLVHFLTNLLNQFLLLLIVIQLYPLMAMTSFGGDDPAWLQACLSVKTHLKTTLTAVMIRLMSLPLVTMKLRFSGKFKHHITCNDYPQPKSLLILCTTPWHPLLLLLLLQPSKLLIQVSIVFSLLGHSHCLNLFHQIYGSIIGSHLQGATGDRLCPSSPWFNRYICLLQARITVVDCTPVANH